MLCIDDAPLNAAPVHDYTTTPTVAAIACAPLLKTPRTPAQHPDEPHEEPVLTSY